MMLLHGQDITEWNEGNLSNDNICFHSAVRLEPQATSAIVREYALLLEGIHGAPICAPANSIMVADRLHIGLYA